MQRLRRASVAATGVLLTHVPVLASCSASAATHTASPLPTTKTTAAPAVQTGTSQALAMVGQLLTSQSNVGEPVSIREVMATQRQFTSQLNTIAARIPQRNGPMLIQIQAVNNEIAAAILSHPVNATIPQTATGLQGFCTKVIDAQSARAQLATRLKCTL
jgi:hypothetical protein